MRYDIRFVKTRVRVRDGVEVSTTTDSLVETVDTRSKTRSAVNRLRKSLKPRFLKDDDAIHVVREGTKTCVSGCLCWNNNQWYGTH